MNKIVLDASAVIAMLNKESGYEIVEKYLPQAIVSAVNFSEIITFFIQIHMPVTEARNMISEIISEIISFDELQASIAAQLQKVTKPFGLSLGDRACLALANHKKLPVLTADKIWEKIDFPQKIILIR